MSAEIKFDPYVKYSKWMDNLEREFTEAAERIIVDFGWDPDNLTEDEISAIRDYIDQKEEEGYDFLMMGFRTVCNWAEDNINE